jgi:Tfp pilus assembly protein PilX
MTRRKQSLCLVLCGSLALTTLAGCETNSSSSSSPSPSPASPTETVSIFINGQCHVAANTIVCRDASRSEPRDRLTAVDWEVFSGSTGISQGGMPSAPGGQVSFTGLTTGTYQVTQRVSAQDGSAQERTYGPLTISPPLSRRML